MPRMADIIDNPRISIRMIANERQYFELFANYNTLHKKYIYCSYSERVLKNKMNN